jgi:AI-2 transport protein TqsA
LSTPDPDTADAPEGSTATPEAVRSDAPMQGQPLPRILLLLAGAAAVVVSAAGVHAVAGTVGPVFLALILVISARPAQTWLCRKGAPRPVGAVAVLLIVYAVVLALAAALAASVAQLVKLLPSYGPRFSELLDTVTRRLSDIGIDQDQLHSVINRLDLSHLVSVLQSVLNGLVGVLSDATFIVILVFFFAVDAAGFTDRLTAAAAQRPEFVAALQAFARTLRRYVLVSTVFGLIVAVVDVGALYWLAVPLPLLWGLLSFVTNYIPNIGFVLGLVPPALLALLEHGAARMLAVVAVYSVINVAIQSFIQPRIVGNAVGLSATLTFLSLTFWTFILGPLGALLAVPLTLFVKALLVDADPALQWLRPLLGDNQGHSS